MARPSKSTAVLENEKKSHRTKAEIAQRKKAEAAALTGMRMIEYEETAADATAHAEFSRVKKLLTKVGKNDALYEAVINDYCQYKAEICRYMKLREKIEADDTVESGEKYKLILSVDKQIESYRKKRFDISKENGFTIASAARSIPKKEKPEAENPLFQALNV